MGNQNVKSYNENDLDFRGLQTENISATIPYLKKLQKDAELLAQQLGGGEHKLGLSDPWFDYVKSGEKPIEGRIYDDKRKQYKINDTLIITSKRGEKITKTISGLVRFKTFEEGMKAVDYKLLIPNANSMEEALDVYYSIPGYKEKQNIDGVLFIFLV